MIAQQKILRVFSLIHALSRKPGKTVSQLEQQLEVSERSVYRYFQLLEEIGYFVDKDVHGRYFLFEPENRQVKPTFEPEESDLIRELLNSAAGQHPLKDAILKKLYQHSALIPLTDHLLKAHLSRLINRLSEAIGERRQVWLRNYHSPRSNSITDRLVEPLEFTANYEQLIAYEPATQQVKNFKVERIEQVEVLDSTQQNQEVIRETTDVFGMPGSQPVRVKLSLNLRAAMLLREEFPASIPFLKPDRRPGTYQWEGSVNGWEGIGRFILGLPGEVEVREPEELKAYLRQRMKGRGF